MDEAKEKLKNIFCFYLWFLLQGFGLQGSLEIHDPNSNWLSWSPTQRAMHALGYVRPFWPQTGTNWSTQLQGKPARATHRTGTGCTLIFHNTRYIRHHWGISSSAPFSHLPFSNAGAQGAGREVCVLPLCSFYSDFSIFPLNSLSLIPSAPCLYLFLCITWGLIFQYWFSFLNYVLIPAVQVDVRKRNS